jgi:hypothetical protein
VRLTVRVMFGFLLVAAVLLTVVVIDVTGAPSRACDDARKSVDARRYAQADKAYDAILDDAPDSGCALTGKRRISKSLCSQAEVWEWYELTEEAHKAFAALLLREPSDQLDCAARGLMATKPVK